MADVKTVNIDNVQWNIKDQTARDKIATLENIGNIIQGNLSSVCNISNDYNYSNWITVPKGTWLIMWHIDLTQVTSIEHLYEIDCDGEIAPGRCAILTSGSQGGFNQINCVVKSNGATRVRSKIFNYGLVASNLSSINSYAFVKFQD